MNHLSHIQNLLLKWLRCYPEKSHSRSKIKALCDTLFVQYFPEIPAKNTYYKVFEPLLRIGLVEVDNESKFKLSPTLFLYDTTSIVGLNLPDFILHELMEKKLVFKQDIWGCVRFSIQFRAQIESVCETFDLPLQKVQIGAILRKMPSLKKVVKTFEKRSILETAAFQYLSTKEQKWTKNNGAIGVYRADSSPWSPRYFFDGKIWRQIPRSQNPDAFNTAVCHANILADSSNIIYDKEQGSLKIETVYFPILLDRLLARYNLPKQTIITQNLNTKIYHQIPNPLFRQIDRIFGHSIKIT